MDTNIQTTARNARNILLTPVTFLPSIMHPVRHQVLPLLDILEEMSSRAYAPVFQAVQAALTFGSTEDYKTAKERLPAFVPATTIKPGLTVAGKNAANLSGVMFLDFDYLENANAAMAVVRQSPHFLCGFVSPSGRGLKVGVYCDYLEYDGNCSPSAYAWYYKQVRKQAASVFPGLESDPSSCNLTRLCFISNHQVFLNLGSVEPIHVERYVKPNISQSVSSKQYPEDRMRELLGALDAGMPREGWYKVLCAMHSDDPAWMYLADEWSSSAGNYRGLEDIEKIWEKLESDKDNISTMATLEYMARKQGYRPTIDWSTVVAMQSPPPSPSPSPGRVFEGEATQEPSLSFQDQVDNYVTAGHPADQLSACIDRIAIESDPAQIATLVQVLVDVCPMNKKDIGDAIKRIKRAARQVEGGSLGQDADRAWLLSNMVTLTTGSGGYFNLLNLSKINTPRVLDSAFGHMNVDEELSPSTWLMKTNNKQSADGICWSPSPEQFVTVGGQAMVNSYRGPTVIPIANDALLVNWLSVCELIFGEYCGLVLDHMAFSIQRPTVKIRWQVLIHGPARSGKTLAFEPLLEVFESSSGMVSKDAAKSAWGDIWLGNKFLLFEEVCSKENKGQFDNLKTKLANSDVEQLNVKGSAIVTQRNVYSMYMLSNNADALNFDAGQNKLLVIESPPPAWSDEVYRIKAESMKSPEFRSAFYHYMLNRDVSGFQYNALPVQTDAMYAMAELSKDDREVMISEAVGNGEAPFESSTVTDTRINNWLRDQGYGSMGGKKLKPLMESLGFMKCKGHKKQGGKWLPGVSFYGRILECEGLSFSQLYDIRKADENPDRWG